jgi:hypothetical protein
MHQPNNPWVVNLTEPSQALRKESDRRSVAISVGKACISRLWWKRDASQGAEASRKSVKAPGGGNGGALKMGHTEEMVFQPFGDGRMDTGLELEGTWKLEYLQIE